MKELQLHNCCPGGSYHKVPVAGRWVLSDALCNPCSRKSAAQKCCCCCCCVLLLQPPGKLRFQGHLTQPLLCDRSLMHAYQSGQVTVIKQVPVIGRQDFWCVLSFSAAWRHVVIHSYSKVTRCRGGPGFCKQGNFIKCNFPPCFCNTVLKQAVSAKPKFSLLPSIQRLRSSAPLLFNLDHVIWSQ